MGDDRTILLPMNRIHCVFSTDDNFCQHLAATLASLLVNNKQYLFHLHVVAGDVSEVNRRKIRSLVETFGNAELSFYEFDEKPYQHLRIDGHIRLASYFRLFLPQILPDDLDKVIYLDADVIVRGDVAELWKMDLGTSYIAGAFDPYSEGSVLRLGLPLSHKYINAGVLVVNLHLWREENLVRRFIQYAEDNSDILTFHDQDTLNGVCNGRITDLSLRWNFQAKTKKLDLKNSDLSEQSVEEIMNDIRIVHFTTQKKPWNYRDDVKYEHEYLYYLSLGDWRDFRQSDRSFLNIMLRPVKRFFAPVNKMRWATISFIKNKL
jgi:lipopolysaccharide biosynthesis glycosyltransferase